jgi:hypothetical protein
MNATSRMFSDTRLPTALIVRGIVSRTAGRWKHTSDDMHLWNDLRIGDHERFEMMNAIELRFRKEGLEFTGDEMRAHYTIASLIELVEAKVDK